MNRYEILLGKKPKKPKVWEDEELDQIGKISKNNELDYTRIPFNLKAAIYKNKRP